MNYLFKNYSNKLKHRIRDPRAQEKKNLLDKVRVYSNPHSTKYYRNISEIISNISLQLKYCRNIFVKYCKIFHRKITILSF